MKWFPVIGLLFLLPAARAAADEPDLVQLADWMSGSFSSAAQAAEDSAYYDIRLEMAPIWTDRDDAVWLYVEQAMAGMTSKSPTDSACTVSARPRTGC